MFVVSFGNTLPSNNILFGVMLCTCWFIIDQGAIVVMFVWLLDLQLPV